MSATFQFIESLDFTSAVEDYFGSDGAYAEFQSELARNPKKGEVIPHASPLRKVRWISRRRGSGMRGGLRVIYIHIPDLSILFMLDVYGKAEASDLSKAEKKALQKLAKQLIEELRSKSSQTQI